MKTPERKHNPEAEIAEKERLAVLEVKSYGMWLLNSEIPEPLKDGRFIATAESVDEVTYSEPKDTVFARVSDAEGAVERFILHSYTYRADGTSFSSDVILSRDEADGGWKGVHTSLESPKGDAPAPDKWRALDYEVRSPSPRKDAASYLAERLRVVFGELPPEHSMEVAINEYEKLYRASQEN